MASLETLIFALHLASGLAIAAFLGVAAARSRPQLAPAAGHGLAGLGAGYLLAILAGAPLHPVASLLPAALLGAAWTASPASEGVDRALRLRALGAGAALALVIAAFSWLDLWWTLPLLGLAFGVLLGLLAALARRG